MWGREAGSAKADREGAVGERGWGRADLSTVRETAPPADGGAAAWRTGLDGEARGPREEGLALDSGDRLLRGQDWRPSLAVPSAPPAGPPPPRVGSVSSNRPAPRVDVTAGAGARDLCGRPRPSLRTARLLRLSRGARAGGHPHFTGRNGLRKAKQRPARAEVSASWTQI